MKIIFLNIRQIILIKLELILKNVKNNIYLKFKIEKLISQEKSIIKILRLIKMIFIIQVLIISRLQK